MADPPSGPARNSHRAAPPGPRDERGVLAARILTTARALFAEHGYAGTSVRAIARVADVDPALVYHYFGSKRSLLDAATTPPQSFFDQITAAWQSATGKIGEHLVRQMIANWQDPQHAQILRAILQIAGNEPSIRDKLRATVMGSVMRPAAPGLDENERLLRASLIASQLTGLAFLRFVWKIEPLAGMSDDEVVAAVAPTIERYLHGDVLTPTGKQVTSKPRRRPRPARQAQP